MIDSHCHLADAQFSSDLEHVVQCARKAGVDQMVTIADTLDEGEKCIEIAKRFEGIFATAGVHPHNAKEWNQDSAIQLHNLLQSSPRVVAVGEIGLDYHYMNSPKDIQMKVFREQLNITQELNMPAVIHSREAIEDTWKIIQEFAPKKVVLHCCTEKWIDVERFIDAGYLLSFTGIATYPKSEDIRMTIRECPLDCMMVETDAPYLAPTPHRGKRNEPAFVREVAKCIAEVKGISFEEVDRITSRNAIEFFGLAPVG